MYTTVAQNKYCENVKIVLFVDILKTSVVFLQVIFKLVASCINLCSNSSLAVGTIGLNVTLLKLKYHEQAILPITLSAK